MPYSDFTLDSLRDQFDLVIETSRHLYADIAAIPLNAALQAILDDNVPLALALSNDKARSELVIAPILLELWRIQDRRLGLFSGADFPVDPAAGLTGVCDFIIARFPEQLVITAPILMLVEAKNEDMKRGYGQCLAEMIAAQRFNARRGDEVAIIHGAVTTGSTWRFLQLENRSARIDRREYYIEHLDQIMGILVHLTSGEP